MKRKTSAIEPLGSKGLTKMK